MFEAFFLPWTQICSCCLVSTPLMMLPPFSSHRLPLLYRAISVNDSFGHGPPDRPNGGSHWSTVILKRETDGLQATKVESLGASNDAAAQTVIKAFEVIQGHHVKLADDVQVRQVNGQSPRCDCRTPAFALLTDLPSPLSPLSPHPRQAGTVASTYSLLHPASSIRRSPLKVSPLTMSL